MAHARLLESVQAELNKVKPTEGSVACAGNCLSELSAAVRQLGPEWDVQPFGSFANGFATVSSDLDVTCQQRGRELSSDVQAQSALALDAIAQVLEHRPDFTIEERIFGARIPLLKLRFANRLEVDLSCHNPTPILNTRLLRAYSNMDSRIRELGVVIKLWSKRVGVCDATKSNLSSYSFTLLVIYFLQVHKDVRLPVLPVDAFRDDAKQEADERVVKAMANWRCDLSLLDLMSRFFAFYCDPGNAGFRWGDEVVSVRCGEQHMIYESMFPMLRCSHMRRLHIDDP
jgi:DNA polymerase sigma